MPQYDFLNEQTGEIITLWFHMNDKKIYIKDGIEWIRQFGPPQASFDTKINPLSAKEFSNKLEKSKGTLGDAFDRSKELSEKRKEIYGGKDPLKEKYNEDWGKKRNRKPLPDNPNTVIEF